MQQICNKIQIVSTHRSTVVLDKVSMAFFNCGEHFIEMTTRANEHLLAQFILALEKEFERHYISTMKVMKVAMTMAYQICSSDLPASTQYHQWLKHPSTLQAVKANNTNLSIDPEMKTSGALTSLSGPQITNF